MSAEPISERTQAILDIHKELQDVTAAIRQINNLLEAERAAKESTRSALYRILKETISLLFPELGNHKK